MTKLQSSPPTGLAAALTTPRILTAAIFAVAVTTLYGVLQGDPGLAFGEGHIGTVVSVLFLIATGVFNFKLYGLRKAGRPVPLLDSRRIWQLCGAGFYFLAFDDAFKVHENLDKLIHHIGGFVETAATDRIDDVIILAYGLIGLAFLWKCRDEIIRIPGFVSIIGIGFVFMLAQVVVDVVTNGPAFLTWFNIATENAEAFSNWASALEESIKIIAASILLAGFVHAWRYERDHPSE